LPVANQTGSGAWLWLITFIGVIVPSRLRAEWRQEWEAELNYRETLLADWNQLNWRSKLDLFWHSTGALLDALWLQPRRWEDEMFQDLRLGVRMLLKHKGFTTVAILSLALGIGANTAIFSVVNAVLLRELPYKDPDQLVSVTSTRTDRNGAPFALPDFIDYRDQNQTLEQIAAYANTGLSLTGGDKTERLQGMRVSANLFQLLGVDARAGRTLLAEDDDPGRRHVAVLTYECWQRRFGGDPHLVGRTLILNGEGFVAVGILPQKFSLPNKEAEMVIPLAPDADPLRNERSSTNFLYAIARIKSGVTHQQAEADLTAVVRRERQVYGEPYLKKTGVGVVPLRDEIVGNVRTALWVLLGSVALVLLIACSNLAALSLARASSHQREMAIRRALGASSTRIVRQVLTECLILALVGGVAGVLLASWGVRFLVALSPTGLPRQQEIGIDLRVLAFAAVASLASAAIFGILPALQGARGDLQSELGASGRGAGEGSRRNRSRSVLVIAEVAVSFLLLIGAGLLIQSFIRVQAIEPGFDPSNTLALRLSLPKAKYHNRTAVAQFCDRLVARIQGLPGIESVGAVSVLPLSDSRHTIDFTLTGRTLSPDDSHIAQYRLASPEYFRAMKIPLLQGRGIDAHDNADSIPVVIINETMARRFWPNQNPIGARINIDDNNTGPRPVEIAGVVGNVKHASLESDPTYDVYLPMAQVHEDGVGLITNTHYWIVRSKSDAHAIESAFRRELQDLDRDVATSNVRSLEDYLSDSVAPRRFNLRVLTIFSVAALVLAAIGVYGVVSYTVTQRTQEIGIRLALGARRANVFQLILGQGLKIVFAGVALGALGAFAMTRVIRNLLFGVAPTDPITFGLVSVILSAIALAACAVPARRATNVDPLIALRNE
jgi:putative ABC transport system permease protein